MKSNFNTLHQHIINVIDGETYDIIALNTVDYDLFQFIYVNLFNRIFEQVWSVSYEEEFYQYIQDDIRHSKTKKT